MKLNTELSHDAEYIGDIQENRVGIDKSNLDFITTLLTSNLYSRPLESFLRETVANAYDSHMEAETDEHILLLIQDSGYKTYTISVRDYGVGVSPERFEKIYRNIGSSTKRDSNDYIGMFGIGRFSCLSCADVANITSYYNGKKYSYLMYKNGGGINIDKISETEGDFRNGLEVSIKMNVSSYYDWRGAIYHLCLFDKLYITYQGENSDLKNLVSRFNEREITNFNTFSRCSLLDTPRNYFKVGNILYDIEGTVDLKTTNRLIINLPIGSVDITPNREALQYTDYTNRTINQKVAETKKELQNMVNTHIKGDISMSEFFTQFCNGGKYIIRVDEELFEIDKRDIKTDISSITIGGEPVPDSYDKFLNDIKYLGINRPLIYQVVNKSIPRIHAIDTSIKHLILGDYVLVNKLDKVTKQTTWLYFTDHVTHTSVILTYNGIEAFKADVEFFAKRCTDTYIAKNVIKEYVDFLFKNIKIDVISNDAVPSSYIEAYRQEQRSKRKRTDTTKIPIRQYCSTGYKQAYLNDIPKKGLIVYSSHTRDDLTLKELANLICCDSIGSIVTLKAEYLPLLANNKRFITLESFLFLRNKILSKLVTAKIIQNKFSNILFEYSIRYTNFPIWEEFANKYRNERRCLDYCDLDNDTFKNIVDYYIKKGWVNQYDIQYFSLSKEEIQAAGVWDEMKGCRHNIIQMLAFLKFGRMPKINLVPVKIPKLIHIKEKTNESI